MGTYTCVCCETKFEAKHKTAICPICKATPSVCVICGKQFPKTSPYTQKTCSPKCRGIYRKESGLGAEVARKANQSKLDRYGTLDPTEVAAARGTVLNSKICPLCGKEFIPETVRQVYCKDTHYGPCPVCGKIVQIKDYNIGPQACSEECRIARINATCLDKYGNKDAVNSEHARQLAKEHCLERYGVDHYSKTDEYKTRLKQTMLERYGVESPLQSPEIIEKAKQTNLKKYGEEWSSQSAEIKQQVNQTVMQKYGGYGMDSPILSKRIKATNLKKYGVEFTFQCKEIQDKIHKDSFEKYGTIWPALSPEAISKRIQTNIERYGCANPLGSESVRDKIKQTCIQKYGGPNPMYDPEMAMLTSQRLQEAMFNKYGVNYSVQVPEIRDKIVATNMERYGVPWYWYRLEYRSSRISQHNQKFGEWLSKIGVKYDFEFLIGERSYDLILPDDNILVEIDPTVTHNSINSPWNADKGLDPAYHLNKSELAEQAGYRCIHVFDWDNSLAIVSLLRPKDRVYARKCQLNQIDQRTADIFTQKYHLQGKCKGQILVYGLYYKGELIQMMSFGKPRYNKNYDFELLRLCTKYQAEVVGGASRLFAQFKRDNPTASVLSYCDRSKFSGSVYTKLGMNLKNVSPPAKVWSKGSQYITDNYLRQRGYDQLFGTNYGKGTSNEQLMLDNGWLPVYDCGQKVFEYVPTSQEGA